MSTDAELTLKDLNVLLDARKAERVGYSVNPATGVETLARAFWVNFDRYQQSAAHLDLYTDTTNCDPETPVATEYITSPQVGRAATFTGKWVHSGCSQNPEADKLIQTLTRVYEITEAADLWARDVIPTYDNEILNLFGLAESEGDSVAFVIYALTKESRAYCMDSISDSDLQTNLAGAGWTYAGRRFEVDPETNTGRMTVACRKVANNSFAIGSPDLEWYQYKTTKQERKMQLWTLINNDDALTGLYTGDSGYNVTEVSISEGEGGTLRIQRTQLLEAYGAADSAYDEERTEVLNPHGMQSGTKYHVTVQNHHLKSLATAYGTIDSSHTGYTLVDTDEQEEGNGLYTKIYKYEKTSWQAWGHDAGANDHVDYQFSGTPHERRRRFWYGIQLADLATAVTACTAGTGGAAPDSGYEITGINVRDNRDGSISVIQDTTKQNNGGNGRHGVERLNPHDIDSGDVTSTVTTVRTVYEDFDEGDLPAGTAVGTDNVISNVKSLQSNGLFRRDVTAETVSTDGAWKSNPATPYFVGENNGDGQAKSQTHISTGIPLSGLIAAFTAVAAETGYVMAAKSLRMDGKGRFSFVRIQKNTESGTAGSDAVITSIKPAIGDKPPVITREWYRRTATAKDALIQPYDAGPPEVLAGAAISDFDYEGVTYTHYRVIITDHHDGAFTVTQIGSDLEDVGTGGTWMDNNYDITRITDKTSSNGTDYYKTVTYTRYTTFRDGYNTCITVMKGKVTAGKILIRAGEPHHIGFGIWKISYDIMTTATAYSGWTAT